MVIYTIVLVSTSFLRMWSGMHIFDSCQQSQTSVRFEAGEIIRRILWRMHRIGWQVTRLTVGLSVASKETERYQVILQCKWRHLLVQA